MKVRKGFVSNSSSSSFICEVCNHTEEVYSDDSYADQGWRECTAGHTFCDDHLVGLPNEVDDCDDDDYCCEDHIVDIKHCPICQMQEFGDDRLLKYALKSSGKTKEDVMALIRGDFSNIADFEEWVK